MSLAQLSYWAEDSIMMLPLDALSQDKHELNGKYQLLGLLMNCLLLHDSQTLGINELPAAP